MNPIIRYAFGVELNENIDEGFSNPEHTKWSGSQIGNRNVQQLILAKKRDLRNDSRDSLIR